MVADALRRPRDQKLESWLRELIVRFQAGTLRPQNFSNLEDLSEPSQLVALVLAADEGFRAEVLLLHDPALQNALALALAFEDLEELARCADELDELVGVSKTADDARIWPMDEPLAEAAIRLGRRARSKRIDALRPEVIGERAAIVTACAAAVWSLRYAHPLPSIEDTVAILGRPDHRVPKPDATTEAITRSRSALAWGGFPEPALWFGEGPLGTVAGRVRGRTELRGPELVGEGEIAGSPFYVLSNGLMVSVTQDRDRGHVAINQFLAVLGRHNVPVTALPEHEIVAITHVRPDKVPSGYEALVTHRNRWLDRSPQPRRSWQPPVLVLDPQIVPRLIALADDTANTKQSAAEAERLLAGESSLHRGQPSEAFLMFWSVIERKVHRAFEEVWREQGRSNRQIDDMDWRASQQIDLLAVASKLDAPIVADLHALRKVRNDVVHNMRAASADEAERCRSVALDLAQLPELATPVPIRMALEP